MRIAYYVDDYLTRRLVIDKIENAKYVRIFALSGLVHFLLKILKKIGFKLDKQIFNFDFLFFGKLLVWKRRYECIHFFNHIYLHSSVNWISQFETMLPRHRNPNLSAIKAIADKRCKAILPLSKCAYNMELNLLESFPEYKGGILQKMFVLHPPQELLIDNIADKRKNDKLTFVFAGNDFFRKAGIEMLNAFEKFNCRLKLIIISHMNINDYVTRSKESHKKQVLEFFAENSDWIDFHNGLPNKEVLQIIKNSDIGLLPTKADTYGFSVLEMQAAGTPVISTNVRALPEINNNECGWLIPVTKDKLGEALFSNEKELANLSEEIETGLYSILVGIFEEYDASGIGFIRKKGKLCLERIAREHNPKNYGKFLEQVINGTL